MDRRGFLGATVAAGLARGVPQLPAFELDEATVASLSEGMASGRWTARGITEQYLERIRAVDQGGPAINSVIAVNPEALEIAARLDQERRERGPRGPLHGIPVLVKDNLDTGDRMATTAGSLALAGSRASQDSTVVAALRRAGAVILGKTNLSEWANYRSTRSTSGWSGVGGQTRNPYVLDRNPCGSSSGSGAAGAANLAAITIGTETDGSITCPSAICGLVGIKPNVGRVSRAGIVPIAASQDTAGPMCRTVADAALVLEAIQGVDPRDPATTAGAGRAPFAARTALTPGGLRGMRLGVARRGFGLPSIVEPVLSEAVAALKSLGAVIIDPAEVPNLDKLDGIEITVLDYEFKAGLAEYFTSRGPGSGIRGLSEIIAFNTANKDREMPWFGQEILERANAKGPLTTPEYRKARADCIRFSRGLGIDNVMARHRLDAMIAITVGPAWPTDLLNGDRFTGGATTPAAVSGYPHITVPAGMLHGLPIGLSFFGKAWMEQSLVRMAYGFEREVQARKGPKFLPTLKS